MSPSHHQVSDTLRKLAPTTSDPRALMNPLTLRVGRLIDGTGGPVLTNCSVVLHQGRIQSILPVQTGVVHTGALDFSAATMVPALIDAHVHLALSGTRDPEQRRRQSTLTQQEAMDLIAGHLQQHARWGVRAVRDGGDRDGHVPAFVQSNRFTQGQTPIVAAPCQAWHAPGRYGSAIGRPLEFGHDAAGQLSPASEGILHLKIINSGMNSLDHFGRQTAPQFTPDQLADLVHRAHASRLSVMVHANGVAPVRDALLAGCDSIEHGYFMGSENLALMADRQIAWVPTAIPMAVLAEEFCLPDAQRENARRTLEAQLELIAAAQRLGVPIVLGTDAGGWGVDHGAAAWQELHWLIRAGLAPTRAIQCATANAARLLKLVNPGLLQPGHPADLVIVEDPRKDFSQEPPRIIAVCINGCWQA